MTFLRHFLSILLLPFVAGVVVPASILLELSEWDSRWTGVAVGARVGQSLGLFLFVTGFLLLTWCVRLFARVGKGTLAPWDPTRELVAVGPYQFVRNPMISAVAAVLLGEALFFGSVLLFAWCVLFVTVNHVYFVFSEEPGLAHRFGTSYLEYRKRVPRWIPHLRERTGRSGPPGG